MRAKRRFNEAAGADPADARPGARSSAVASGFNEAAGADPADAHVKLSDDERAIVASMRPRGQTPRMPPDGWRELRRSTVVLQ